MNSFKLHMEILPEAQKQTWPTLGWTKTNGFVLYGGTAIALRCGHRSSIDFDFFTDKQLNHKVIYQELQQSGITTHVVQDEKNSLTLLTEPGNVKLSFFGDLGMGRVGTPTQTDDGIVSVASPLDLLGTKLKVIMQRAEAKDYIDIAQLLRDGSSLIQGLGAARSMYGSAFAPAESLRALTFFDDGDLAKVNTKTRQELRIEVARVSQMFPIPIIDIVSKQLSDEGIVRQVNRDRGGTEL
jgi:predicted nucleotidyltransferase component of viral defense system